MQIGFAEGEGGGGQGWWSRGGTHLNDQSPDHKVRLMNSFEASVRFANEMEVMMQAAQSVPIAHQSPSSVASLDITLKDSCLLPHKYVPRASSGVNVINALLRNGCHIKCRGWERRQANEVESLTYGLNWSSCRLKDGADGSVEGRVSFFWGAVFFSCYVFIVWLKDVTGNWPRPRVLFDLSFQVDLVEEHVENLKDWRNLHAYHEWTSGLLAV